MTFPKRDDFDGPEEHQEDAPFETEAGLVPYSAGQIAADSIFALVIALTVSICVGWIR